MTKVVKSVKKTKEVAIATPGPGLPLSNKVLQSQGIETKLSSKDLVEFLVQTKYSEIETTGRELVKKIKELKKDYRENIESIISTHVENFKNNELRKIVPKDNISTLTVHNVNLIFDYSTYCLKPGTNSIKLANFEIDEYSRSLRFSKRKNNPCHLIIPDIGTFCIEFSFQTSSGCKAKVMVHSNDINIAEEVKKSFDDFNKRAEKINQEVENFQELLPGNGELDLTKMMTEVKILLTREALSACDPDFKLALQKNFNVKI